MIMAISEARSRANDKYIDNLDDIKVRVKKGMRDELRNTAKDKGFDSLNSYIKYLL